MTTGEQLDLISTVTNVSALTHLLNPSGEGGGGDIIINSELILIDDIEMAEVAIHDDIIFIEENEPVLIEVEEDIILIAEVKIGEIDVVC